jgi:membrane protease YdiL (CAAX protease family)
LRDLLVFYAIACLAAVHFLLKTKDTVLEQATWFYVLTFAFSLIILLWLRVYHGEKGDVVDYDENLKRDHLPFLFGSVAGIAILSSLLVRTFAPSALYVPRPGQLLSLSVSPTAAIIDDLLYNFVLVAPSEECVKLMGILVLYRKTGNELISSALPVGIWAALHAYQAYVGSMMPILLVSAFLSGLILYAVLKYTSSLENAILSHGLYNSLVVVASLMWA